MWEVLWRRRGGSRNGLARSVNRFFCKHFLSVCVSVFWYLFITINNVYVTASKLQGSQLRAHGGLRGGVHTQGRAERSRGVQQKLSWSVETFLITGFYDSFLELVNSSDDGARLLWLEFRQVSNFKPNYIIDLFDYSREKRK